jgi:hypothetical protein
MKTVNVFLKSAGVILFITGLAKLISGFDSARVLLLPDPILALPIHYLFASLGTTEVIVAIYCFWSKSALRRTATVAWLSTLFVGYRLELWKIGVKKPCPCLGSITGAIHLSPHTADTIMKVVLAYLVLGSFAALFYLLLKGNRKDMLRKMPVSPPTSTFSFEPEHDCPNR